MNNKFASLILALALVFSLSLTVFAQDDMSNEPGDVAPMTAADPDADTIYNETSDATIEAITDNSDEFYGTIVTIEGTVTNFLSPTIFEVGEEEVLTNSYVLVANNSSHAFPASMIEGTVIRVTGRVLPSYDVANNDGWTYEPYGMAMNDSEMATEEAMGMDGMQRMNVVDFIYRGYIPGTFGQHTVLEVLNVENVEIMSYEDLIGTN
ncbi:MAG: hypothetical protein KC496_10360 [Anaerolineae bacterium]|nr:hypothetical protein [Anaerolineae bacterium]